MNAPDAVERLRNLVMGWPDMHHMVSPDDARAILDHITALTVERDAAVAALWREIAVQHYCDAARCTDTQGDNCLCGIAYRTAIEADAHKETTDGR